MSVQPERILVRGVNWLGDAVMTTPALARLREAHPSARITLLTSGALADLWIHHPSVNDLIAFRPGESPWSIARRLRRGRFDWGLVFPNSPRAALELFLAGIPRRIGYARPWRSWLLTDPVPPRRDEVIMRKRSRGEVERLIAQGWAAASEALPVRAHHIYQYLDLVAAAGAEGRPLPPRLVVMADEVGEARAKFLPRDREVRLWLGLSAGAAYGPAKRWPLERFVETAAAVQRQTGCGWLVLGGSREAPETCEIAQRLERASVAPVVDLAGRTSLRQLCALFRVCAAVVSNDSGPMHVAAALGVPVVALFGSTSPELTGPGNPGDAEAAPHVILRQTTPCAPCFRRDCPLDLRCLVGIPVDRVVSAVLEVLKRRARPVIPQPNP